jgi:hypothetical protein
MPSAPRKLLLNDEGSSALHFLDLDDPGKNWSYEGPGRDLQLVGAGRILRSSPQGYVELDLNDRAVVRVTVAGAHGVIEWHAAFPMGTPG